jgi:hypothetical protein
MWRAFECGWGTQRVISVDLLANEDADANVVLSTKIALHEQHAKASPGQRPPARPFRLRVVMPFGVCWLCSRY